MVVICVVLGWCPVALRAKSLDFSACLALASLAWNLAQTLLPVFALTVKTDGNKGKYFIHKNISKKHDFIITLKVKITSGQTTYTIQVTTSITLYAV